MKYVFSGYGSSKKSIGLYELNNENFHELDSLLLNLPSFVAYHEEVLYTFYKKETVVLQTYKIIDNKFLLIDEFPIPFRNLTHFVYSKKHQLLIGCSYQEGKFFSITVSDGKFQADLDVEKQIESEELSRCHCVFLSPREDTIGIVNIALDKIFLYHISSSKLILKASFSFPKGSGPRHAIYNHDGAIIYAISEYSNEIFVIDILNNQLLQRISTLSTKDIQSFGATLVIINDRLYASNRGEDSIAEFKIREDRTLEYTDSFYCGGNHPRHMIISNDGKYLISCNKNSNEVAVIDLFDKKVKLIIPLTEASGVVEIV